jgi:predicted glycogen debranching enzyme
MIALGRKQLQDLESALGREWLETNGLGGYASSTAIGINTRKYHGLLVAALRPPVDRVLLVSRLEETLVMGESRFHLGAAEYQDTIYPDGFRYLEDMRIDPFPIFTYVAGGVKLTKSVFMLHGRNATCVTYHIEPATDGSGLDGVRLEVRPILAYRSHHHLMRETSEFDTTVTRTQEGGVRLQPIKGLPPVFIACDPGEFAQAGYWYRNHLYRREKESGYACSEDLYSPGVVTLSFAGSSCGCLTFSADQEVAPDARLADAERHRRAGLVAGSLSALAASPLAERPIGKHLLAAADAFVARRGEDGRTLIAGYPWFSDWGRDTMISLPGLTLATGRHDDARRILATYAASIDHGLVPNLFPDFSNTARYNTIDATLWMFEAVRRYYDVTGDGQTVTSLLPHLRDSIRAHVEGTLYGIKTDDDGLVRGGEPGVQLTWMDAMFQDEVMTARRGKPVEINALWYNALRVMADFCGAFGGLAEERKYDQMAAKVSRAFNKKFWNDEKGCLYDCIDLVGKDDSVRPNQVIAISLTYPVLDTSRWKPVMDVVERELLTPYGLRTLSPNDPRYRGVYEGDLGTRDKAYHQGTVWTWLLGPFVRAYLRTHGRSEKTLVFCTHLVEGFEEHLSDAGLGQVSEIFDGDPPHRPRGCIAQAWSVAALLRVIAEDLADRPSQQSDRNSRSSNSASSAREAVPPKARRA